MSASRVISFKKKMKNKQTSGIEVEKKVENKVFFKVLKTSFKKVEKYFCVLCVFYKTIF